MFNKLFRSVRGSSSSSAFGAYLNGVWAKSVTGAPTVEQARHDYQSTLRWEFPYVTR